MQQLEKAALALKHWKWLPGTEFWFQGRRKKQYLYRFSCVASQGEHLAHRPGGQLQWGRLVLEDAEPNFYDFATIGNLQKLVHDSPYEEPYNWAIKDDMWSVDPLILVTALKCAECSDCSGKGKIKKALCPKCEKLKASAEAGEWK